MKELKIIRIIDDRTVIINGGSENDIFTNDIFQIYELGDKIVDPETNEELGFLEQIKDTIIAVNVMEKMTICTKKPEKIGLEDFYSDLMYVEQNEITGGLKSDNPIKVGDKVKKISPGLPF